MILAFDLTERQEHPLQGFQRLVVCFHDTDIFSFKKTSGIDSSK